jgi:hypothetical protein
MSQEEMMEVVAQEFPEWREYIDRLRRTRFFMP